MKTHQGYRAKPRKGAECSKCGDWIGVGEKCALIQPGTIEESGSVHLEATAIHGVVCMGCYEDL